MYVTSPPLLLLSITGFIVAVWNGPVNSGYLLACFLISVIVASGSLFHPFFAIFVLPLILQYLPLAFFSYSEVDANRLLLTLQGFSIAFGLWVTITSIVSPKWARRVDAKTEEYSDRFGKTS